MNPPRPERPLIFGEVLFDNFPDGSRILGGAPFNVAWHLQAWGTQPRFVSRVGADAPGAEIRAAMKNWRMDDAELQDDPDHGTGSVQVALDGKGHPSFEIVENRAYDFIAADANANADPTPPAMIYHGSLALRGPSSRHALEQLRRRWEAPFFIDVNLRAPWWSRAEVLGWLGQANWAKLNDGELTLLSPDKGPLQENAMSFCKATGLSLLVVTIGEHGALAVRPTGEAAKVAPEASTQVIDTVGAGDAFTSVLILGLLKDWPLADTLARAQSFASALVGVRGATISDKSFYSPFIKEWGLL